MSRHVHARLDSLPALIVADEDKAVIQPGNVRRVLGGR
jgi:hypothetical protein